MGRYKEAPSGFECPYKNACPHLGGISTTWTGMLLDDGENQDLGNGALLVQAEEDIAMLESSIECLEKENAELRARLQAKQARTFKANGPKKKRPACSAPKVPRKRGAPKGHPPWSRRMPDHIDKTVNVPPPNVCPHCACADLHPSDQQHEQIQEDIELQPKTVVTRYAHDMSFCPRCRRAVFQTASGELRNAQIGPVTKAAAVYLRHEVKLSYRDVQKVFTGLFNMPFVPASAMAFDRDVSRKGESHYEDLRDKIRAANMLHGDETHWRIDGKNAFVWYAGNPELAFFHVDRSRSAEVALSIYGPRYQGDLVSDDYAVYRVIAPKKRQSCLAHLITKATEITKEIDLLEPRHQDRKAVRFCN